MPGRDGRSSALRRNMTGNNGADLMASRTLKVSITERPPDRLVSNLSLTSSQLIDELVVELASSYS